MSLSGRACKGGSHRHCLEILIMARLVVIIKTMLSHPQRDKMVENNCFLRRLRSALPFKSMSQSKCAFHYRTIMRTIYSGFNVIITTFVFHIAIRSLRVPLDLTEHENLSTFTSAWLQDVIFKVVREKRLATRSASHSKSSTDVPGSEDGLSMQPK